MSPSQFSLNPNFQKGKVAEYLDPKYLTLMAATG